jgi:hypothetical protein
MKQRVQAKTNPYKLQRGSLCTLYKLQTSFLSGNILLNNRDMHSDPIKKYIIQVMMAHLAICIMWFNFVAIHCFV